METGMLTPEEAAQRGSSRTNLNNRMSSQKYGYEMASGPEVSAKSKLRTKTMINISFVLILLTGIAGSFVDVFDMEKFTKFLEVFAYVWTPLVISYGGGRAVKGFVDKKYNKKKVDVDQPPM